MFFRSGPVYGLRSRCRAVPPNCYAVPMKLFESRGRIEGERDFLDPLIRLLQREKARGLLESLRSSKMVHCGSFISAKCIPSEQSILRNRKSLLEEVEIFIEMRDSSEDPSVLLLSPAQPGCCGGWGAQTLRGTKRTWIPK